MSYISKISAVLILLFSNHLLATEIDCGIIESRKGKYEVSRGTLDIPFITKKKNPDFMFGCVINNGQENFSLRHELSLPTPEKVSINVSATQSEKQNRTTIKSDTMKFKGYGYILMQLEEGDQRGIYDMDIVINNQLAKKVSFNVE